MHKFIVIGKFQSTDTRLNLSVLPSIDIVLKHIDYGRMENDRIAIRLRLKAGLKCRLQTMHKRVAKYNEVVAAELRFVGDEFEVLSDSGLTKTKYNEIDARFKGKEDGFWLGGVDVKNGVDDGGSVDGQSEHEKAAMSAKLSEEIEKRKSLEEELAELNVKFSDEIGKRKSAEGQSAELERRLKTQEKNEQKLMERLENLRAKLETTEKELERNKRLRLSGDMP